MRLDHLLSKELISIRPHIVGTPAVLRGERVLVAEAMHEPSVLVVVAHGWNIDEELPVMVLAASTPLLGGWNVVGVSWVIRQTSTLLGPEITGRLVGCFWEYGSLGRGHTSQLAGGGVCGVPGGFVRCLRTA